jgi:hypothetical protein
MNAGGIRGPSGAKTTLQCIGPFHVSSHLLQVAPHVRRLVLHNPVVARHIVFTLSNSLHFHLLPDPSTLVLFTPPAFSLALLRHT